MWHVSQNYRKNDKLNNRVKKRNIIANPKANTSTKELDRTWRNPERGERHHFGKFKTSDSSIGELANRYAMIHHVDGVGLETRAGACHNAKWIVLWKEDTKISNVLGVTHVSCSFCSDLVLLSKHQHHHHRGLASYTWITAHAHICLHVTFVSIDQKSLSCLRVIIFVSIDQKSLTCLRVIIYVYRLTRKLWPEGDSTQWSSLMQESKSSHVDCGKLGKLGNTNSLNLGSLSKWRSQEHK